MSQNFIISPFSAEDFPQLYAIEQAAHAISWTEGTFKNCTGEHYFNVKLQKNAHSPACAFAVCQVVGTEATLLNIAVDPAVQNQGIGGYLLQYVVKNLQEKKVADLWLEVRESNASARYLYEKLGFNAVGLRKNYYPTLDGKREHAIVMGLHLNLGDWQ